MRVRTKYRRPPREEVIAISMLVGEMPPMNCSCCRGNGMNSRLWGQRVCAQCKGTGFDIVGPKTLEALELR